MFAILYAMALACLVMRHLGACADVAVADEAAHHAWHLGPPHPGRHQPERTRHASMATSGMVDRHEQVAKGGWHVRTRLATGLVLGGIVAVVRVQVAKDAVDEAEPGCLLLEPCVLLGRHVGKHPVARLAVGVVGEDVAYVGVLGLSSLHEL